VCRPKPVEQLRNIGIINSTTRLHLVGYFYEIRDKLAEIFSYSTYRKSIEKNFEEKYFGSVQGELRGSF
jgi:hypothetical protein